MGQQTFTTRIDRDLARIVTSWPLREFAEHKQLSDMIA
jgi:hypothetical protein